MRRGRLVDIQNHGLIAFVIDVGRGRRKRMIAPVAEYRMAYDAAIGLGYKDGGEPTPVVFETNGDLLTWIGPAGGF